MARKINNDSEGNVALVSEAFVSKIKLALVLLVAVFVIYTIFLSLPVAKLKGAGEFGDSYGFLNCLFTGVGFIAVAVTIKMQHQQTIIQLKEIENQSKEKLKSDFEGNVFKMFEVYNDIVNSFEWHGKYEGEPVTSKGRRGLNDLKEELRIGCSVDDKSSFLESYDQFFFKYSFFLGHYHRFVYKLFSYISTCGDADLKDFYGKLFRAQLSNVELALIYYNACTDRGGKMKSLIHSFVIMDNLSRKELFNPVHPSWIEDVKFYD